MERHEKEVRLKRIVRFFTTLLVVLILIALIFFISQVADKATNQKTGKTEKVFFNKT
jgi:uncharacterized membrane protein